MEHFNELVPHAVCWLWDWRLIALHAISNGLIALAYFAIPVALFVLAYRYRIKRLSGVFLIYALFIFGCGVTHLMDVLNIWFPLYWLDGWIRALTAVVSIVAAVVTVRCMGQSVYFMSRAATLERKIEQRVHQLQTDPRYSSDSDKEAVRILGELRDITERVLSYAPMEKT